MVSVAGAAMPGSSQRWKRAWRGHPDILHHFHSTSTGDSLAHGPTQLQGRLGKGILMWGQQMFSVKGQIGNVFSFESRILCVASTRLCPCILKAAIGNMQVDGHGYIPIKLYSWTLKFEFHIIFMCHEYFFFFQPFRNVKTIFRSWAIQK